MSRKKRSGTWKPGPVALGGPKRLTMGEHKVIVDPPGKAKMSDLLEEFVEPYVRYTDDDDSYRNLVAVGVVAWNLALFRESERNARMDGAMTSIFHASETSDRADLSSVLQEMIARKETHFAAHRRMIVGYELAGSADKWHLTVSSTLDDVPEGGRA